MEKTSTRVSPAELILYNSIRLTEQIPTQAKSPDQLARQSTLVRVTRDKQLQTDFHALVEFDPSITEYPVNSYVLFTPPVGRSDKLLPRHRGRYQEMDKANSIYTIDTLSIRASVIDSYIEVIIGLPDIRSYRLIYRILSYFDTPDPSYLDTQYYSKEGSPEC